MRYIWQYAGMYCKSTYVNLSEKYSMDLTEIYASDFYDSVVCTLQLQSLQTHPRRLEST